jgi:hypothetical protein
MAKQVDPKIDATARRLAKMVKDWVDSGDCPPWIATKEPKSSK